LDHAVKGLTSKKSESSLVDAGETEVTILVDTANIEAVATAMVLRKMCTPHLGGEVHLVPSLVEQGCSLSQKTSTIILLVTAGCFTQMHYLDLLIQAAKQNTESLPVISEAGFRPPTRELFVGTGHPEYLNLIVAAQTIFKQIAVAFTPSYESQVELEISAGKVATRLIGHVAATATSKSPPTAGRLRTETEGSAKSVSNKGSVMLTYDENIAEKKSTLLQAESDHTDGLEIPESHLIFDHVSRI